jgi:hypothetical protein
VTSAPIDHVLLAVPDLEGVGEKLLDEHGLASVEGGRHTGWGTANRIVPLGDGQYIELVAVVDETRAMGTPFGSAVRALVEQDGGLLAWCVAVADADAHAERLGLSVTEGSRRRPDSVTLSWRTAGLEAAMAEQWRPFFIQWEISEDAHPGRMEAPHRVEPRGIAWIELACDLQTLREWLDDQSFDVRLGEGPPGLLSVGIATAAGEVVLS